MAQTIDLRGLVRPQLVEATKREDNPNIAEFRLQPLERGFGHTLGNAMRRMLLSSLRGSAVWAFRIDGVVHEHQTIPGVVEDVHQIIGNLKTLTLEPRRRTRGRAPRIQKTGPGAVTAADIDSAPACTIIDPQPPPVHAAGRSRDPRGSLRQEGARLHRVRPAPARARHADRRRADRRDLQSGAPRELRGRRDPRRAAHGLRPADADGRDQRHDHAGGGGELRGRARADALPVLRRLRLARVGAGDAAVARRRAATRSGWPSCRRRSTTSSCRCGP